MYLIACDEQKGYLKKTCNLMWKQKGRESISAKKKSSVSCVSVIYRRKRFKFLRLYSGAFKTDLVFLYIIFVYYFISVYHNLVNSNYSKYINYLFIS